VILNAILPSYVPEDRLVVIRASEVTEVFNWAALVERLVGPPESLEPIAQPVTLFPTLWD
jgi:hypothetical protein